MKQEMNHMWRGNGPALRRPWKPYRSVMTNARGAADPDLENAAATGEESSFEGNHSPSLNETENEREHDLEEDVDSAEHDSMADPD